MDIYRIYVYTFIYIHIFIAVQHTVKPSKMASPNFAITPTNAHINVHTYILLTYCSTKPMSVSTSFWTRPSRKNSNYWNSVHKLRTFRHRQLEHKNSSKPTIITKFLHTYLFIIILHSAVVFNIYLSIIYGITTYMNNTNIFLKAHVHRFSNSSF